MQANGAVGTKQQGLLDIGRARGSGYEVDRARHFSLAEALAQPRPDFLVMGEDVASPHHHDVVFRQEVQARRIVRSRQQRQRSGLADPAFGMAHTGQVATVARPLLNRQYAVLRLVQGRQPVVLAGADFLWQVMRAQPFGNRICNPAARTDRYRCLRFLRLLDEMGNTRSGGSGLHRKYAARRIPDAFQGIALALARCAVLQIAAKLFEDELPVHDALPPAPVCLRHCARNVLPSGVGMSRCLVQAPAKGRKPVRRLRPPRSQSPRAARRVAT